MELVLKLLPIFFLGVAEIWVAIPAGLALGLPPVLIAVAAAAGAISGMLIVLTLGEKIRKWFVNGNEKKGRGYEIWIKYGVAGLGLLAPLTIGSLMGTALGVAFGAPRNRLLFWMSLGIAIWSAIITMAGALGMSLLL